MGTFDYRSLEDTPDEIMNRCPSYGELTELKLEHFILRNADCCLRIINTESDLDNDEDLLLFRLQTCRETLEETYPDEIYRIYDFHITRKHLDEYYYTYAGDNYFYKDNRPQWLGKYDGPIILLLAFSRKEEFHRFITQHEMSESIKKNSDTMKLF